ncbi:MAG: hypothetical protein KDI36_20050, partial [Pseudomonadales bacterium]|nr:hypothetical protein [Pseudomonadales bacterium]
RLTALIEAQQLAVDPASNRNVPAITSDLAQLGKLLFFSSHLSGDEDVACVSCHHPTLGGADNLSLSVGVNAVNDQNLSAPSLLGPGRHSEIAGNFPVVPRNAPTTFNSSLWDRGMFWDSRVESLQPARNLNGSAGAISTPDSLTANSADTNLPPGITLPDAQARFPVTSVAEMRDVFLPDADNQTLRQSLAGRFGPEWAPMFTAAFGDPDISFDRIAEAIAAYERSQTFTGSPWQQYVQGDIDALTDQQKTGAELFLTPVNEGGAGCNRCHSGSRFTDEQHHIVAFPQISDDRGRENVTGDTRDRYLFRTPSLLNITESAPYGHAGLYADLEAVVRHYVNPGNSVRDLYGVVNDLAFANRAEVCDLPQIQLAITASGASCEALLADGWLHSSSALDRLATPGVRGGLGPTPRLNNAETAALVAFLEALTDPCTEDRACLDPWIVDADDDYPDDSAIIGTAASGGSL